MNNNNLFYRKDRILTRINPDNILFLKAENNYVQFVERGDYHTVRITLEAALKQLPEGMFVQIHRSYAVAVNRVNTISKNFASITFLPRLQLPVSKQHYKLLMNRVKIIGIVIVKENQCKTE